MQGKPAPFSMWSEEFLIPKEPISEDCLYLNVWSSGKSKNKKAVLVWIYGGGFASGGSAVPIYDGEAIAKKGIVFVSINYRVGIFGFFARAARQGRVLSSLCVPGRRRFRVLYPRGKRNRQWYCLTGASLRLPWQSG